MAFLLVLLLASLSVSLASVHRPKYGHSAPSYHKPAHGYCDPKAAPHCVANTTLSYCLEDEEYPTYEIKNAITADAHFAKKYSDIPDQSAVEHMVQHVSREEEEAFDYTYYSGYSKGDSPYDHSHWLGPDGYACPSEILYALPLRARNVAGDWRVIVNEVDYYTQTARLETCLGADSACRLLAPCYNSKCTQKHAYQRLLSFDPCDPYKGLFIDIFKLPSFCSCHIKA